MHFSCFFCFFFVDEPVKPVVSLEFPIPPGESPIPDAPPTPPPTSPISDTVDAPPPAIDKATQSKDAKQQEAKSTSGVVPSNTYGSVENEVGPAAVSILLPVSGAEPTLESPIAQPEELQLVNGLTADANRDVSPLAEPDITKEAPPFIDESSTRTTKVAPPFIKENPAQVVSELPPLPAFKESCVPSVKETIALKPMAAPVVTEIITHVITESLSVVAKDTPSSAIMELAAPVAKETPTPVDLETAVVKETPSSVATETSKPVVKETVVEEPCPDAKNTPEPIVKETPSPMEPVCVAVKDTPPSSPAPAEEREETPPPQTTALESTMQGTCA